MRCFAKVIFALYLKFCKNPGINNLHSYLKNMEHHFPLGKMKCLFGFWSLKYSSTFFNNKGLNVKGLLQLIVLLFCVENTGYDRFIHGFSDGCTYVAIFWYLIVS